MNSPLCFPSESPCCGHSLWQQSFDRAMPSSGGISPTPCDDRGMRPILRMARQSHHPLESMPTTAGFRKMKINVNWVCLNMGVQYIHTQVIAGFYYRKNAAYLTNHRISGTLVSDKPLSLQQFTTAFCLACFGLYPANFGLGWYSWARQTWTNPIILFLVVYPMIFWHLIVTLALGKNS